IRRFLVGVKVVRVHFVGSIASRMGNLVEDVVDYSLLIAQSYLPIRLSFTRHAYFKNPFFYFFVLTGGIGCISVVGFIIAERFPIPKSSASIFKLGFMINIFEVTGSTIGKLLIAAHRYSAMRNMSKNEEVWSHRLMFFLVGILGFLSICPCVLVVFCGYSFHVKENVTLVLYFDDAWASVRFDSKDTKKNNHCADRQINFYSNILRFCHR
ncbi:hypothetical protein PMAYCL1PPCAC_20656, partial [Pristionchus mayeri]